jgi:hypothetical protein
MYLEACRFTNVGQTGIKKNTSACLLIELEAVPDDGALGASKRFELIN